jgi:hypothetical protein
MQAVQVRSVGSTVVATRGDRLHILTDTMQEPDTGNTVDILGVLEVDGDGRWVGAVSFNPDDLDAAFEELDRRYRAGEGAPHQDVFDAICRWHDSFNRRDWDDFVACRTSDLYFHDHRDASYAVLDTARLMDLSHAVVVDSPDSRLRITSIEAAAGDTVLIGMDFVSAVAGYTAPSWTIVEARGDRICRIESYAPEELAAARARFDELTSAGGVTGPAANGAVRALARQSVLFRTASPAAWGDVFTDDAVYEDRRRGLQVRVVGRAANVEHMMLVDLEVTGGMLLATRGDRLSLSRGTLTQPATQNAIEVLALVEVDATGRMRHDIAFEPDDLDAAFQELDVRYLAELEAAQPDLVPIFEVTARSGGLASRRAWGDYAALLADDMVLVDHRIASFGSLTKTELLAIFESGDELTPGMVFYATEVIALAPDVSLTRSNTLRQDGALGFDSEVLTVALRRDECCCRLELFDADQLDAALARFDELNR